MKPAIALSEGSERFYEKVIRVKADVAALRNVFRGGWSSTLHLTTLLLPGQRPAKILSTVATLAELITGIFATGRITGKDCDYRRPLRTVVPQN